MCPHGHIFHKISESASGLFIKGGFGLYRHDGLGVTSLGKGKQVLQTSFVKASPKSSRMKALT